MTNSELMKTENRSINLATANAAQMQLVRDTYCVDHTDPEFANFLHLAVKYGLDPYAGHICSVKYKNKKTGGFYPAQTIVERDGYLAVALRDPSYDGMVTDEFYDDEGNVLGATCNVYRKGMSHPSANVKVFIKEYKDPYNKSWLNMPITMIRKVAESQALRKSFGLTGTYSSEEYNPVTFNEPKKLEGETIEMEPERKTREVLVVDDVDDVGKHEKKSEPEKTFIPEAATKQQRKMIEALIAKYSLNRDALKKFFVIDTMKNLTKKMASEMIEHMEKNESSKDDGAPKEETPKTANKAEEAVVRGLMKQAEMNDKDFEKKFNCKPDAVPQFKFNAISGALSNIADEKDNK